ncbi:protein N-lysine methyltransferase METTL21D isoform X2 [Lepeophtheirus salmonis]|uniref:protein N-lysine methyltransferase METTL21D isoform X2 n=1 Tax=Lepeophtheirus salmonis TaxID=72036 RepID=UPI00077F74C4|nr:protein-lysine methyltransferase METTL21D-like [Lepeophtheirus salmonis]
MVFVRLYEATTNSSSKKTTLSIGQEFSGEEGVVIWDAALVLAKYLETFIDGHPWKRALELGAGTGFIGLLAGVTLGIDCLITDVSSIRPLIEKNVKRNASAVKDGVQLIPFTLDWNQPPSLGSLPFQCFDLILLSDGIYYEAGIEPLVSVLHSYSTKDTDILIAYEVRPDKDYILEKFLKLVEPIFNVKKVVDGLDPVYSCDDIFLFHLNKKNEGI